MSRYLTIFHWLWKLRRVDFRLSCNFKRHSAIMKTVNALEDGITKQITIGKVLHRCRLLKAQMIHFVSNLHSYIMHEVLEGPCRDLMVKVEEADNLDVVIDSHDIYLNRVISRLLLNTQGDGARQIFETIFALILRFCFVEDQLFTSVSSTTQYIMRARQRSRMKQSKGGWGTTDAEDEASMNALQSLRGRVKSTGIQLKTISKEYLASMQALLTSLRTEVKFSAGQGNLLSLAFRLDFNNFYSQREEKKSQSTKISADIDKCLG